MLFRSREGTPCWADLGAPDVAKAREFYGDVFSWTVRPGGPETGGYSVAELNARGVAGLLSGYGIAPRKLRIESSSASCAVLTVSTPEAPQLPCHRARNGRGRTAPGDGTADLPPGLFCSCARGEPEHMTNRV